MMRNRLMQTVMGLFTLVSLHCGSIADLPPADQEPVVQAAPAVVSTDAARTDAVQRDEAAQSVEKDLPEEVFSGIRSDGTASKVICRWRGKAPFCKDQCKPNETEVKRSTCATAAEQCGQRCYTGSKVYCCTVD